MTFCTKSIVECLRDKGIEPEVSTSGEHSSEKAVYALDYSQNNFYYSLDNGTPQWWAV